MRRASAMLLLTVAVACSSGTAAPKVASTPSPEGSPTGNFILYVSNQSFDRSTVDIEVTIDGNRAVSRDFAVEGQHSWIRFDLDLPAGDHELSATSEAGDARLTQTITAGERVWAVLDYWCCGEPDDPRFTLHLSDEPVAFG